MSSSGIKKVHLNKLLKQIENRKLFLSLFHIVVTILNIRLGKIKILAKNKQSLSL